MNNSKVQQLNTHVIGLAGLGYWGKNLLRNFYELDVLHTACDANPFPLVEQQKKFSGVNYSNSFDDLLSHSEIKAIAISTPAVTHYDLVKKALKAGKDVFVEKPLALTVREGVELVRLAEKANRILMVGHILQYHPAVIKLKELISHGQLGKIQYIYSSRLNIGKLRTEENILWSFAPHDISVILMLLEDEPVKVAAFGGDYLNKGIHDTTLTTLEFKNGVKGHIFVNWLHPYKEQKLIVVGSETMAVFDDMSKEKLFLYPHKIEWKNGKVPVAQKADCQVIPVNSGEPLRTELNHFLECIFQRKKPLTDGNEGLRVLKILELAEKSISESTSNPQPPISSTPKVFHPSPPRFHNSSSQSKKPYFIHESTYIDEGVEIGEGTRIWYFSHILGGSKIGKNCIIGQNVMIGPDVEIGDRCKIQNNVSVYTGVRLEDEVFCGPSCVFTNVYNPRAFIERKHEFRQTLVKSGATIGANATIICGITIGKHAIVGAGAVVKSDVSAHAIVAGVPAKQIGWTCKCGTTLKFNNNYAACGYCSNTYLLQNGKLTTDNNHE
ncbi:MAG: Gfo/Idh/MocA family oxidoreductase [Candidatus Jettenia sp. CY-1]|nr:MAG: Gfo/Idh/MocA family oxidoreductase [Candidatus Jettenia sp. CY-1]